MFDLLFCPYIVELVISEEISFYLLYVDILPAYRVPAEAREGLRYHWNSSDRPVSCQVSTEN